MPPSAAPSPEAPLRRRAAFLDRDGVINADHGYVSRIEDFEFLPGVLDSAGELARHGLLLVVVTNQAGIGRGMYTEEDFARLTRWMCARFDEAGAPIRAVYHCPHHPTQALGTLRVRCDCRKPAPGMLLQAARDWHIDLERSVFFGDKCDDMRAGLSAGVGTRVLLGKDGRAEPDDPCPEGGVTARFAALAQALRDPALRTRLGLPVAAQAAGATPARQAARP
jgi:D-glycero-D-manno-heptose 1,7-bisphosphate phosphatase